MGQKINPISFRLSLTQDWHSHWFGSKRNFPRLLRKDIEIRDYIYTQLKHAGVSRVDIARSPKEVSITIVVAKPGIVIGRGGSGIELLRKGIEKMADAKVRIAIEEEKQPNLSAQLVSQSMVSQIERRMPVKRILAQTAERVITSGAKGVRLSIKGRVNGADVARTEKVDQGLVPLHTLKADIDFATNTAHTKYGTIGIKVWINRGQLKTDSSRKLVKKRETGCVNVRT